MHYVDVCVRGEWDGILVIDENGMCVGVYVFRQIEQWPLPFEPSEIEAVRCASLRNRLLAALPFDLYTAAVANILVLSPMALGAALWMPSLAVLPILSCAGAIWAMYSVRAFIFTRLPIAMCGLCQIIGGSILLIRCAADFLIPFVLVM